MVPWSLFRWADSMDTIDLVDGIDYQLVDGGYTPRMPRRSTDPLSGTGPYAEVEEPITLHVLGSTAQRAYENLARLKALIDRASAWRRGLRSSPVLWTMLPSGSARTQSTALQATLRGWAGDELSDALPAVWQPTDRRFIIQNVTIVVRRGIWVGPAQSATSSLATASSTVHEMVFPTAHSHDSPVKLQIGGITKGVTMPASVLLVSDQVANAALRLVEAETATATNYTAIADTVVNTIPSGGQILRFAPGVANSEILSGAIALPTRPGIIAIYAVLRSLNPSVVWSITPVMTYGLTAITVRGRTTVIDGTYFTNPQVVFLGTVTYLGNASDETLKLAIKASTVVGANLDFDVFGLLNLSAGNSAAVQINGGWETSVGHSHILDDATLTRPRPAIYMASASNISPWPASAALPLVSGICTPESPVAGRIRAAWLAPMDVQWRLGVAPTVFSTTMTATRLPAYPVPE